MRWYSSLHVTELAPTIKVKFLLPEAGMGYWVSSSWVWAHLEAPGLLASQSDRDTGKAKEENIAFM